MKSVALHSYKGGTGKSTIGSNLAAMLAKKGFKVVLLDLDVYAPSLQSYFRKTPSKWINDFLFENAQTDEVLMDLTSVLKEFEGDDSDNTTNSHGKLMVGFSNTSKEEIYRLDGAARQEGSKLQLLRKFVMLREQIAENYDVDYIIIDTSPGIRYWSINALAVADTIFLSLKMDGIDIDGTRIMAREIYNNFRKLGTKSFLLLNRVAGYCIPPDLGKANSFSQTLNEQSNTISKLKQDLDMEIIASIPCYCDIQFNSMEYLTALKQPPHPFTEKIDSLIERLESIN
jgi:chromosome partitioning protein